MSGLELRYFVLKPRGDDQYAVASRAAMRCFADHIQSENPALADDLRQWAHKEAVTKYDHDLGGPQV